MSLIEKIKSLSPSYRRKKIEKRWPIAASLFVVKEVKGKKLDLQDITSQFAEKFDEDPVGTMTLFINEVSRIWYVHPVNSPTTDLFKVINTNPQLEEDLTKAQFQNIVNHEYSRCFPYPFEVFLNRIKNILDMSEEEIERCSPDNMISTIEDAIENFPEATHYSRLNLFKDKDSLDLFQQQLIDLVDVDPSELHFLQGLEPLKSVRQFSAAYFRVSQIEREIKQIIHQNEILKGSQSSSEPTGPQGNTFSIEQDILTRKERIEEHIDYLYEIIHRLKW